jgi:capsular exopolysaccharide synthesis family protein
MAEEKKPPVPRIVSDQSRAVRIEPHAEYPLVLDHNLVMASESFGVLRSRVMSVHSNQRLQVFVITSSGAGEGKTLTAINLALSLGQLGRKRVLLVDGDLRASKATNVLRLQGKPGLAEYLLERASFSQCVHPTAFPSLWVVPAGQVPDKSLPEMLEGPRLNQFRDEVKENFDITVVDSLPVGAPVADLELTLTICDAYLFVVRLHSTSRESLDFARDRLDRSKLLGLVINNADEVHPYNSHYYYYGSSRKQK